MGLAVVALLVACGPTPGAARGLPTAEQASVSLFRHRWVWRDEQGETVALSRWRGEPLVVATIYTSCSTVCPRTIHKLRKVYDAFRRKGRAAQFVLVTLDPDADSPERLRAYKEAEALPQTWHLLTGSTADTRALTELLDVHLIDMGSHIFHESKIFVFDARGMLARSFVDLDFDDEASVL